MDMESWSLDAPGGFEWRVNLAQDDGKPSEYDCYDDEDTAAFQNGEWTFVQVHVVLVYTNEDGSEIELGEDYLGNTQWGASHDWSAFQPEINEYPVMDMKMTIWDRVQAMFKDIADGAGLAIDREIEAYIVRNPSGYKPTNPADLVHGMQLGIYAEEMAFDNNLSVNEKWYETRLGTVEEVTHASNGLVAVHLRVDDKDYFFMSPPEHQFKVYREG